MGERVSLPNGIEIAPFKRAAFVNGPMDMLTYLECDCSYTSVHEEGTNITLLYDTRVTPRKLVGVQIHGISEVVDRKTLRLLEET